MSTDIQAKITEIETTSTEAASTNHETPMKITTTTTPPPRSTGRSIATVAVMIITDREMTEKVAETGLMTIRMRESVVEISLTVATSEKDLMREKVAETGLMIIRMRERVVEIGLTIATSERDLMREKVVGIGF